MKAILEFTLPEDQEEHRVALDGSKWKNVAWSLDQWLRNMLKYENKDTISVQEVREQIYSELRENGVEFE